MKSAVAKGANARSRVGPTKSTIVAAIVAGMVLLSPRPGRAQDSASSQLPVQRLLQSPPAVGDVANFSTVTGGKHALPLTATLAVSDLRMYDAQLGSLFPPSASYYPMDSLRALKVARSQTWLARLRLMHGAGVEGRQLVDFAEVAARAGDDTLARRLIDKRLAELPTGRAGTIARSIALGAAIVLFADDETDSARIARNLPIADVYAAQLSALPAGGYATRSDSVNVLYRQFYAQLQLVQAADALQMPARVVLSAEAVLPFLARLGLGERLNALEMQYPYLEVATALTSQANGRARLDSLNARLLALVAPNVRDVAMGQDPVRLAQDIAVWEGRVRDRFASFDLLGNRAPPITAHAWLNTPDSAYAEAPRVHSFADGIVRVLGFGNIESNFFPAFDRIQRRFPERVQCIVVTQTEGHVGPDIATPSGEVAWLSSYYLGKRQLATAIAVWAGPKLPGDYGSVQPQRSPNAGPYHVGSLNGFVIIDGAGIVRAYHLLDRREQETRLARRLSSLVTETGHTAGRQ
jgi:hypothetical protein